MTKCRNHPQHPPTSICRCLLWLKNQYKIVLNIFKKKIIVYNANKNIQKNWNDYIIFCYKKNLEISFQNGPEHEIRPKIAGLMSKDWDVSENWYRYLKQFPMLSPCNRARTGYFNLILVLNRRCVRSPGPMVDNIKIAHSLPKRKRRWQKHFCILAEEEMRDIMRYYMILSQSRYGHRTETNIETAIP